MIDAVIKIGGSLGRGEHLRPLCACVAAVARRHRALIVPGGGVFADTVRQQDCRLGLSAATAHWMAILAMDLYGYLLADLIPGSAVVRSVDEAREVAAAAAAAVLLPFETVKRADALPHAWSVTSDAIAAWVCREARAPLLVLLKDGKGMRSTGGTAGSCSAGRLTLAQLAAWPGVDGHLHRLMEDAGCDLWIIDGERPELLAELLDTGRTDGFSVPRGGA